MMNHRWMIIEFHFLQMFSNFKIWQTFLRKSLEKFRNRQSHMIEF